jgi:phage shock protein A
MSIFSRLADIVNSNINALLDRAEEPEKLIRLIIQEMEDTLVEVRSAAVKMIADKKEIERQIERRQEERDEWQRRAEFALTREREDLARGALLAKGKLNGAIADLQQQWESISRLLAAQDADIVKLQNKLADAKAREKSLITRHVSASARAKIRSKLYDERVNDALGRFEQIEKALDELEGKVESYDLGRKKTLAQEISEMEFESSVEGELNDLKSRLSGNAARKADIQ